MEEGKRAFIWRAFTTEGCEPKFARCEYCDSLVSRGSEVPRKQTTTNLKNHMKNAHPKEWKKLEQDDIAKNDSKFFLLILNFKFRIM